MAWFRPMGANEVAYHEATVLDRTDDHPGATLAYYGSRGETRCDGRAGVSSTRPVRFSDARCVRGPSSGGRMRRPGTDEQLVSATRPGFELVVSAHKSVAVLVVADRVEEMHSILDIETRDDAVARRVGTPEGAAARNLSDSRDRLEESQRTALDATATRRERHVAAERCPQARGCSPDDRP